MDAVASSANAFEFQQNVPAWLLGSLPNHILALILHLKIFPMRTQIHRRQLKCRQSTHVQKMQINQNPFSIPFTGGRHIFDTEKIRFDFIEYSEPMSMSSINKHAKHCIYELFINPNRLWISYWTHSCLLCKQLSKIYTVPFAREVLVVRTT